MPRRGHSTRVGKIAKICQDRRASEIRMLGELLRRAQHATGDRQPDPHTVREGSPAR
jgi:hypothetical protein